MNNHELEIFKNELRTLISEQINILVTDELEHLRQEIIDSYSIHDNHIRDLYTIIDNLNIQIKYLETRLK